MAIPRNDIPRNADCRGGVFAVFAKIPPPILFAVFWSATRHATSLQTPSPSDAVPLIATRRAPSLQTPSPQQETVFIHPGLYPLGQ